MRSFGRTQYNCPQDLLSDCVLCYSMVVYVFIMCMLDIVNEEWSKSGAGSLRPKIYKKYAKRTTERLKVQRWYQKVRSRILDNGDAVMLQEWSCSCFSCDAPSFEGALIPLAAGTANEVKIMHERKILEHTLQSRFLSHSRSQHHSHLQLASSHLRVSCRFECRS